MRFYDKKRLVTTLMARGLPVGTESSNVLAFGVPGNALYKIFMLFQETNIFSWKLDMNNKLFIEIYFCV